MTFRGSRAVALVLLLASLAGAPSRAATLEEGLRLKAKGKLPEAADVLEKVAAAEPRNPEALGNLATVQGWLHRFDDSVRSWQKALRLQPNNLDFRLGLARVLYWKHDFSKAAAELAKVLAVQPDYGEALSLRGDVLLAWGDVDGARQSYRHAQTLAPGDAELERKLQAAAGPPKWRLDAGFVSDNYTNFRRAERAAYAQVGRMFGRSDTLWLRYDWLNEFSKVDTTLQLGGAYLAGENLLILAAAGFTPENDFRPGSQWDLGLEVPGLPGFTPLLSYRALAYDDGTVHSITPGLRVQALPWASVEAKYGWSRNIDHTTTGVGQGRLDFTIGDRWAPYVAIAHGREDLPPQRTAVFTYYVAGGVCNITPTFSIRVDYSHERRPEFYAHNSIVGGVTLKY